MDIDYVIAWVDGQDPKHIAARKQYAPNSKKTHFEATTDERYQNNGEIYYQIASLIKYAPFIRRILIVTDNQTPQFLSAFIDEKKCAPSFLRIISHDEIFKGLDAARPSFNSLAIETCLWRIPDLSEHFVYANDDFFINAPISIEDFFINGNPVLYGYWKKPENRRWKYQFRRFLEKVSPYRYNLPNNGLSQWKGATIAGVKGQYLNVHHYPHPLRRSTLQTFFAAHPQVMVDQVQYRYRDIAQFNVVALANNLEIAKNGIAICPKKGLAYVDFVKEKRVFNALKDIENAKSPFGCVQGFELFEPAMRAKIHHVLLKKFDDVLPQAIKAVIEGEIGQEEIAT